MTTQPDLVKYPKPRVPTWKTRIACFFGLHDWTSRIDLGAEVDKERANRDTILYFYEFSTPVCRHCPRQLPPWRP